MNDARSDEELFEFASLDADGPARPLSASAADALVANVLSGVGAPPSGSGSAGAGKALIGAKLAVGIATLVFVAGGGTLMMREPRERFIANAPRPSPALPEETVTSAPTIEVAPPAPPEPEPVVERRPEPVIAARPEPERVERPAPRLAPEAPVEAPADLLAEANRLRRAGSYREAESTYRRIVSLSPRSREAHVARVAAASIRLERLNDPRGAASLYREAQRGSGGLAAEATFGLARASRALGDTNAEKQALRSLVERFPSSAYVRTATERLRALGVTVTPREGQ
jgi:TolA-binding protein